MKLTDAQMLSLWRSAQNLEPERSDCSVEVFEGYDINTALITAMRQWYLNLLDTAPLQFVQTSDIASQIKLSGIASGVWQFALGIDVRRLISLQIEGCPHTTKIINYDNAQRQIALNANRYCRNGINNPLAVQNGRNITIYCKTADNTAPKILSTVAVVDPGDECYVLDESAISLIPKANLNE